MRTDRVTNTTAPQGAEPQIPEAEGRETEKIGKGLARSERSVRRYQFLILRLLILAAVLWILFFKIVGLTHMPNGDMYPRIDAGDLVLFYRLDKDVRAQDVVVIEKETPGSGSEKQLFIERVIAVGGDTVEITDAGRVIVNGNAVLESNIFYRTAPYEGYVTYPLTLERDECFVLADMRDGGADSRYFGPVSAEELRGTVITILRRNNL